MIDLRHGDALTTLRSLNSNMVDCCVTSPPYWMLRDYAAAGQIGLEPTIEEWRDKLVAVFREVRRVLKPTGSLWLNLGDCYMSDRHRTPYGGLKPKDLVGQPWLLAFALRADGWHLRRDIIWHKPNAMPESIADRPATAHEYVFLLTKEQHYYYDAYAVMEPTTGRAHSRGRGSGSKVAGWQYGAGAHNVIEFSRRPKLPSAGSRFRREHTPAAQTVAKIRAKNNRSFSAAVTSPVDRRNRRSVWTIATRGFAGAHFATFPEQLVEPCILAGSSEHGCCAVCGAPYQRRISRANGQPTADGWQQSCDCAAWPELTPAVVLDPFAGSGTTLVVAERLGRDAMGIEINPEYVALARRRLAAAQLSMKTPAARSSGAGPRV